MACYLDGAASMIELPVCRWRGDVTVDGHHECSSHKLTHGPNGVLDELCHGCYLRDHEPTQPVLHVSIRTRVWSASMAYARWVLAGCPRPTEEEVAERKATCDICPHLVRGIEPRCGLCGCLINKVTHLFGTLERPGKAEMATEVCPDNPPRWKSLL